MKPSFVSVTRGDIPSFPWPQLPGGFWDSCIWDNSIRMDFRLFGRYLAADISGAIIPSSAWALRLDELPDDRMADIIFTQDDDVSIHDITPILDAWNPGRIVVNMPPEYVKNYEHTPEKLVGFGTVFERSLIKPTFERYLKHFSMDALFLRECDRVFTGLNHEKIDIVDVPFKHMPWANDGTRLYQQPGHNEARVEIRQRVMKILEAEAGSARSAHAL